MVVPRPASERPDGFSPLRDGLRLTIPPDAPEVRAVADMLQSTLFEGAGLVVSIVEADARPSDLSLYIGPDTVANGEGYRLLLTPNGVRIHAATPAGLFYGAQTLRQLVDSSVSAGAWPQAPTTLIEDGPRYPWRGFMLDSSRHFQPVATVKRLLDAMAYLKLNVLHWHLVDDNGWRIEIKKYPLLTERASRRGPDEPDASGFYSQEEAREIVEYAKARHITVIPEIEVPAHASAALAVYPRYTCSGEPWAYGADGLSHFSADGDRALFCPSREETYTFLEDILSEVMDVFDGPVIHLGGDERPEGIWTDCPRCQDKMTREGLESESALQHAMMCRLTDFVNARGRRTMAWLPTAAHGLPENQIAEDWFYDLIPDATALGNDVVNARDRFTYLDYPNFPGRQKPDWMPDLSIETMYTFEPTPEGLSEEQAAHVLGAHASLWTEFIEESDLATAIFPRLLAFAEVMWTPRERRDWADFARRMRALEPAFARMGFPFATPEHETGGATVRPATVTTSMAHAGPYRPECAFDGKFTRCFWSEEPPKAGDDLTITLDEPMAARRIALYTGGDFMREDVLAQGSLEVSADGETFREAAPVNGPRAEARLDGAPVKAIRVRVTADQNRRLAIREVVVE